LNIVSAYPPLLPFRVPLAIGLVLVIYHVPRTIGRINNPRHAWLFNDTLRVDVALNESSILAH
jgi:hypothetical protein